MTGAGTGEHGDGAEARAPGLSDGPDDAGCPAAFRRAVEEGLASLDRGRRVPIEDVRGMIKEWVRKYAGVDGLVEAGGSGSDSLRGGPGGPRVTA